ncbi:MAG: glycosyltransferase family 4 protein [Methylotenera sp.]|nr:glycosyltransferase family 4 protein [Oligoflexia bacterium]
MVSNADPKPRAGLSELVDALNGEMKALIICLSHSWGGLEQVASADTLEIAHQGLDVRAMVLRDSPIHAQLKLHPEVKLEVLDYRPRDYFDFNLKKDLTRLCDPMHEGINVVHLHQTSLLGSVTPWLWNRPEVTVFASRHIMNNHDKRNFFHRMIYGRLDALIVMSQTLRKNVLATHPLRERQVKVVNLGLDFVRFDPAVVDAQRQRAEWGADFETVVIGLVGRIDPAKGQATFIKAAAGLTKRLPEGKKLKFVIVGEETLGRSSNHLGELQKMVKQFHLEEAVVFAGFQTNIPEIMSAFDIFVMPSRQEAFGLVAIEAMAMECPIVISSGGSAAEIIGQEEYGVLMRPDDAFDLQRQLRYMIDHPDTRKQMGILGRKHVQSNYDRNIRLRRTLEIYERALRRRAYQH